MLLVNILGREEILGYQFSLIIAGKGRENATNSLYLK